MTRRQFLSSTIGAASLVACTAKPRRRLRIGTFLRTAYEPLFIARALGAYDDRSIQIIEFPASSDMVLAFQNRAVDVATLTLDELLRVAANGHDIRTILVAAYSAGGDAIVGRPDLKSLADLRGRTVGFEANALGAYILVRALEKHKVPAADVKTTVIRADQLVKEFSARRLDAVVTYEPFRSELIKAGAKDLFTSAEIPSEIGDVIVTRKSILDENLPALRQLTDGWFRSLDHIAAHPTEAASVVASREKTNAEGVLGSLKLLRLVDRAENRKLLAPGEPTLAGQIQALSSFMVRQNLLAGAVEPEALRDDRLVKEESK